MNFIKKNCYKFGTIKNLRKSNHRESEELIDGARKLMSGVIRSCLDKNCREWRIIKNLMRDELSEFMFQKTKRSPMLLPIVMEI